MLTGVAVVLWMKLLRVNSEELVTTGERQGGEARIVLYCESHDAVRCADSATCRGSLPEASQSAGVSPLRSSHCVLLAQAAINRGSIACKCSRKACVTCCVTGRMRPAPRSNCHAGNQVLRLPSSPSRRPSRSDSSSSRRLMPSSLRTSDESRRSPTISDHDLGPVERCGKDGWGRRRRGFTRGGSGRRLLPDGPVIPAIRRHRQIVLTDTPSAAAAASAVKSCVRCAASICSWRERFLLAIEHRTPLGAYQ